MYNVFKRIPKVLKLLRHIYAVIRQFYALRAAPGQRFELKWRDRLLMLWDATTTTGFDRHYVFHTAWASRCLADFRPVEHIDISSSLYFVVNASAFVPMRFYDYRPANISLSGLACAAGELHNLPFETQSVASLSCLHVLEHIGLGRYGDALDYDGDLKAATELKRVIAPKGRLMLAVPVGGVARIQFNAHRIYTFKQVMDMFTELKLLEFSLIPNYEADGGLIRNADPQLADRENYGCGCFLFERQ